MKLRRWMMAKRWCAVAMTAYALGGCIADRQITDFLTTEVARVASDLVGQIFTLFTQSIVSVGGS